jgi:hypothetical protein
MAIDVAGAPGLPYSRGRAVFTPQGVLTRTVEECSAREACPSCHQHTGSAGVTHVKGLLRTSPQLSLAAQTKPKTALPSHKHILCSPPSNSLYLSLSLSLSASALRPPSLAAFSRSVKQASLPVWAAVLGDPLGSGWCWCWCWSRSRSRAQRAFRDGKEMRSLPHASAAAVCGWRLQLGRCCALWPLGEELAARTLCFSFAGRASVLGTAIGSPRQAREACAMICVPLL